MIDTKTIDLIFAHLEEAFDGPCNCLLAFADKDGLHCQMSSMTSQESWMIRQEIVHECTSRTPTRIVEICGKVRGQKAVEGVLTDTARNVVRHGARTFVMACTRRGVGNPIFWATYETEQGSLMKVLQRISEEKTK